MNNWYKLDNAAKLFPPIANTDNSSVFRVSIILHDEVNPEILQKTVNYIYKRFPSMFVKMHKGVFWNYFDTNEEDFIIHEEKDFPCSFINRNSNNGFFIRVLYFHKRISVETFHSITDGNGAMEFIKTLLYYYFTFCGASINHENKVMLVDDYIKPEETEDSFQKYYEPQKKAKEVSPFTNTFVITGEKFECPGTNVTCGVMSAMKVHALAKSMNATVTTLVVSVLMHSIYHTYLEKFGQPRFIVIAIPVNFHKVLPSQSLRNFFGMINVGMEVTPTTTVTEIIAEVSKQFKDKITPENVKKTIAGNLKHEKNIITRWFPLLLKAPFIRLAFNYFGETKNSISVSSLGKINIPDEMGKYISHMEAILYPSKKGPINCGICTINDALTVSFSKNIVDTEMIRQFFTYFSKTLNIETTVYSNLWGDQNE